MLLFCPVTLWLINDDDNDYYDNDDDFNNSLDDLSVLIQSEISPNDATKH